MVANVLELVGPSKLTARVSGVPVPKDAGMEKWYTCAGDSVLLSGVSLLLQALSPKATIARKQNNFFITLATVIRTYHSSGINWDLSPIKIRPSVLISTTSIAGAS